MAVAVVVAVAVVGAAVVAVVAVEAVEAVAVAAVVVGVDAPAFSLAGLPLATQGLGLLDELGGAHGRIIGYLF
jgi:hypothetical protein